MPGRREPRRRGRRGRGRGHRGRHRRRAPRVHRGSLATDLRPRPRRPAGPGRGPAGARPRRHRPNGVARHGQAPGRERVRRGRRGLRVPPLRADRRRGGRSRRRHRQPRRRQPDRARAGRRLRAGDAVELPAAPGVVEGRAVPGRRQHVRAQAERAHATHGDPPDEASRRGRAPGRSRQPGAGCRPDCRCAALDRPAGRPRLVHRRPRDRAPDHGGRIRDREEGRPRARRQEPQHRLRRRRPRGGPRLRADRSVPPLRPGLLGRRPAAGRGVGARRVRRFARRARWTDPARRTVRREGRDRAADQCATPREGGGVRRPRSRRGRHAPSGWRAS